MRWYFGEEELQEANAEPAGHHQEGDDQPRCGDGSTKASCVDFFAVVMMVLDSMIVVLYASFLRAESYKIGKNGNIINTNLCEYDRFICGADCPRISKLCVSLHKFV